MLRRSQVVARARDPGRAVREGRRDGGERARALQARRGGGALRVVLVGVAQEKTSVWPAGGTRSRRASAFRVAPPVDLPEQLLLLHPRPRLGAVVRQDDRVRAVLG